MTRRLRRGSLAALAVPILAALAVIALGASLLTAAGRDAAASDVYPVPASGSYTLAGHGFGHGRGMSQWGAYGMATQGKTAANILDFYYPGSQPATMANQTVRVLLTKSSGTDLVIVAGTGTQWLIDKGHANQKVSLPSSVSGATVAKWKVAESGTSIALSGWWANAWHPYPETGQLVTPGPVSFATDAATLRMVYPDDTQREYEGTLDAVLDGGLLRAVNNVAMESYLKDVVPHEEPSSWPASALQAQAIAARTYAAASLGGAVYDICDSGNCQAYTGDASYDTNGTRTAYQTAATNAAIAATAGQIRSYGGAPIFAQYSSSDGGWTVDAGVAYKPAQPDPWDVYSPYHDWTATLPASAVEAAYPAIGTLRDIAIGARDGNGDWGGRVLSLTLDGSAGAKTVSGEGFRTALGLRSSWFTLGAATTAPADAGLLHPLTPARILDTRTAGSPLGPGQTRTVQVAGLGGVPAGALGAVLNVTATDTTGTSYLTVWPTPGARPDTSNLNWDRGGQTVANLVFTKLGPDGTVQIYNSQASASVIVDVFGYFAGDQTPGGLAFVPLPPQRVLDTRYGIGGPAGPLGPRDTRTVPLAGVAGGVGTQAVAIVANLTETRPTAESYLTMWPAGSPMPATSNINMLPQQTRANAAVGLLGSVQGGQGGVSLYNNLGSSDAILDVLGEYVPAVDESGRYAGIQPSRLLDTRTPLGGHAKPLAPGETFALGVLGRGGVPADGVSAVVLNVTAVAPTAPTYVTAWASGRSRPGISNLNAGAGAVVPNLVVAGVGSDGAVDLYNDQGSTHLVVDVVGWISG